MKYKEIPKVFLNNSPNDVIFDKKKHGWVCLCDRRITAKRGGSREGQERSSHVSALCIYRIPLIRSELSNRVRPNSSE